MTAVRRMIRAIEAAGQLMRIITRPVVTRPRQLFRRSEHGGLDNKK